LAKWVPPSPLGTANLLTVACPCGVVFERWVMRGWRDAVVRAKKRMRLLLTMMLLVLCAASSVAASTNCSLGGLTPIAIDAATAWEVAVSLKNEDRGNFIALLHGGKVLVLGAQAEARILETSSRYSAKKIRILSDVGLAGPGGRVVAAGLGFEGWVYEGLCK